MPQAEIRLVSDARLDTAIAQVKQTGDGAQLEQLQLENQRLRQERDEVTSKLQAFKQLLLGSPIHQEEQPVEVTSTSGRQKQEPFS